MKLNNKLHIPISTETKEKLQRKAKELGLNLTELCRLILMKSRLEIEVK